MKAVFINKQINIKAVITSPDLGARLELFIEVCSYLLNNVVLSNIRSDAILFEYQA